jgi:hypothetical protein
VPSTATHHAIVNWQLGASIAGGWPCCVILIYTANKQQGQIKPELKQILPRYIWICDSNAGGDQR